MTALAAHILHAVRYTHSGRACAVLGLLYVVLRLLAVSPPWTAPVAAVALSTAAAVTNALAAGQDVTLPLVEQAAAAGLQAALAAAVTQLMRRPSRA